MKTLNEVLKADHSAQTKVALIDLIKGVKALIGSEYEEIVGITDIELSKLKKDELIDVIKMIKDAYQPSWESMKVDDIPGLQFILSKIESQDDFFEKSDAANADFAAELGSIDFDKLIGGPLNACVTAQTNASVATVNFIKEVGFTEDKKLVMVDFSHSKLVPDPDDSTKTISEEVKLSVPLISILNIPSLRIENVTIDFNVKLNSVYSRDVSDKVGVNASVSAGWGPVKMKVSASYQRSSSTGIKVEKEYSMNVKVVATNDEMPAGLEKVLGILAE